MIYKDKLVVAYSSGEIDARQRNKAVVDRMHQVLPDEEILNHVRESAKRYREGELSPAEYFELFLGIFGEQETRTLFPEIVALLPVAEKRATVVKEKRHALISHRPTIDGHRDGVPALKKREIFLGPGGDPATT